MRAKISKYIKTIYKMVQYGVKEKPDIVHANDLPGLPIGWLIAKLSGAKLIYDSHELWSGYASKGKYPVSLFKFGLWIEKRLSQKADGVITVSDSIAETMKKSMSITKPVVVRNLPYPTTHSKPSLGPLRSALGLSNEIPLFIYQGGVIPGRGLFNLIDAMGLVRGPSKLVLLGDGELVEPLKQKVKQLGLSERVLFHPKVPYGELLDYTCDADIGISSFEGICLSYRYCLPNKLFEYAQARLPVIVSNLPEMTKFVSECNVGLAYEDGNVAEMARVMQHIVDDPLASKTYRENMDVVAKEYHWHNEERKVIDLYSHILN